VSARIAAHAWLLLGVSATIVLLCLLSGVGIFHGLYRGRVYPGVQVALSGGPIEVGGQTREEAIRALGAPIDRFLSTPIVVRYLGKEWRPTPRELGAQVDVGLVDEVDGDVLVGEPEVLGLALVQRR